MNNKTLLYLGLGAGVLWFLSRHSSPASVMAQQAALANAAALQSQAIQTNATQANIKTGVTALENIIGDFT